MLYGARLQMNYQLLWPLGMEPLGFRRIMVATSYLIPLPVFFVFRRFNPVGRRGHIIFTAAWVTLLCLSLATLAFGPLEVFRFINNRPWLRRSYGLSEESRFGGCDPRPAWTPGLRGRRSL